MSARNSRADERVVNYYRCSDPKQDTSIAQQKQWAARVVRSHCLRLLAEFEDEGIPGSELGDRRPGLMALLAFCEKQAAAGTPVTAVVCWDGERFSRADSISTAVVLDQLRQAGCSRLLTQEGWTDLEDDVDRLLFNIKQDMTRAAYSKAVSRNVSRAALRRALEGQWVAGRVPFAYVVGPDGHLALGDPAHVETVRWIFHQYANSADSLADIARKLRERRAPTPAPQRMKDGSTRGGTWTRLSVWHVLHRRAYLGDLIWNVYHRGRYTRIKSGEVTSAPSRRPLCERNKPDDVIRVEGAHPPLIDPETVARCLRKLEASRWTRSGDSGPGHHSGRRGEWVLSGMLYCGHCGARMSGRTRNVSKKGVKVVRRHYFCRTSQLQGAGACRSNYAAQEVVLEEVAKLIRESFTDPARVAELTARVEAMARREDDGAEADRRNLRDRFEALERQIAQGNKNLALLPADRIPGVVEQLRAWERERDAVCRDLARLEVAAQAGEAFVSRVKDALAGIQALEETITTAPAAEVRDALAGLVEKVTLHFDHSRKLKDGRLRTELAYIDIELHPEAAHLFPTGCTRRSACRGPRRRRGPGPSCRCRAARTAASRASTGCRASGTTAGCSATA
jgi:DNA invertase Pin-like site-specific DNA recombinase